MVEVGTNAGFQVGKIEFACECKCDCVRVCKRESESYDLHIVREISVFKSFLFTLVVLTSDVNPLKGKPFLK